MVPCSGESKDLISLKLWERGATGIVEHDAPGGDFRLQAFFETPDESLAAEFGGDWVAQEEFDWVEAAKDSLQPMLVGDRLFIVPDWRNDPTPEGRIRIDAHLGRAYGTGAGEATRLALIAVERYLRPGDVVLDIGTGTGILSVAAARLGARAVIACDVDPEAVEVAAENLKRDGVDVGLFTGSADAVRSSAAQFLVANISAATIIFLSGEFARVLQAGGRAAVAGFLEHDNERVRNAMAAAGFEEIGSHSEGEWWSLVFRRV